MPSFSSLIIDPGHGFCDEKLNFDAGHQFQNLHEVSLIDDVIADLTQVLVAEQIPHRVLDTRRRPGLCPDERAQAQARELQISVHFGHARQIHRNGGSIYARDAKDHALCNVLADVLDKWGSRTCASYAGSKILHAAFAHLPQYDALTGVLGVQIEPFCLNAIDAIVYAARLRVLGAELGQALVAFMRGQNSALGVQRTTVWSNGPMGRDVFGG